MFLPKRRSRRSDPGNWHALYFLSYISRVFLKVTIPQLVSTPLFHFCQAVPTTSISLHCYSVYPHRNQHGQTLYFSSCPHFRYGFSTGFLRRLPTVKGIIDCSRIIVTKWHLCQLERRDYDSELFERDIDTFEEPEARGLFGGLLSVFDLCVIHTFWIPTSVL